MEKGGCIRGVDGRMCILDQLADFTRRARYQVGFLCICHTCLRAQIVAERLL